MAASVTLEIKMLPVTAAAVSFGAVSSMVDRYNNRFEKIRSRGSGLTSVLRHHLTAAFGSGRVSLSLCTSFTGEVFTRFSSTPFQFFQEFSRYMRGKRTGPIL